MSDHDIPQLQRPKKTKKAEVPPIFRHELSPQNQVSKTPKEVIAEMRKLSEQDIFVTDNE